MAAQQLPEPQPMAVLRKERQTPVRRQLLFRPLDLESQLRLSFHPHQPSCVERFHLSGENTLTQNLNAKRAFLYFQPFYLCFRVLDPYLQVGPGRVMMDRSGRCGVIRSGGSPIEVEPGKPPQSRDQPLPPSACL